MHSPLLDRVFSIHCNHLCLANGSQNLSSQAAISSLNKSFLPKIAQPLSHILASSSFCWMGGKEDLFMRLNTNHYVVIPSPKLFRKPFGGLRMVASFPSLLTLITSNWCNYGGELMVNRCHLKPKCHADTDFHAPSGQKMPSKARRRIHKLAVELATAGNGGKWVAFSLDWFGVAHPCQLFFSTWKLEGEVQVFHQVVKSKPLESMLQHTPAFLDSWGLKLWEEALISYFRLSFSCN